MTENEYFFGSLSLNLSFQLSTMPWGYDDYFGLPYLVGLNFFSPERTLESFRTQMCCQGRSTLMISIWGFPKMVVPNNHGFSYLKWSFWGVKWGYHHLRKHPYSMGWSSTLGVYTGPWNKDSLWRKVGWVDHPQIIGSLGLNPGTFWWEVGGFVNLPKLALQQNPSCLIEIVGPLAQWW